MILSQKHLFIKITHTYYALLIFQILCNSIICYNVILHHKFVIIFAKKIYMINLNVLQKFTSIDSCGSVPFEQYLANQMDLYIDIANKLLTDNRIENVSAIITRIIEAKTAIINTVEYSIQGRRLLALMTILKYIDKHMPPLCHEEKGSNFYRMRVFEDKRSRDIKELFHIPFSKQGKVKTQRYSMPGLPCLYLGKSLYGCWEELNRPPLYSCMFSKLTNTDTIKLWDFRIPQEIENSEKLSHFLTIVPLIIACSIKSANIEDDYKPEYIVPQIMLEILSCGDEINKINGKKPHNIVGIKYRSVLANNEFDFSASKCDNIVIPAIRNDREYDDRLCELFRITKPTCEEFEKIRYHKAVFNGGTANDDTYTYKSSLFGQMEYFISDIDSFPLLKIDNKTLKK